MKKLDMVQAKGSSEKVPYNVKLRINGFRRDPRAIGGMAVRQRRGFDTPTMTITSAIIKKQSRLGAGLLEIRLIRLIR
jgi:hypothetical protein